MAMRLIDPRPAMAMRLIDSHVHVWAPPDLATKYPYQATLIGTTAAAPPVDGAAPRLLAALKREAASSSASASSRSRVGALVVQAGCHQYDHSYLTDTIMASPPGQLVGCALADPSQGGPSGVAALRALAALERSEDGGGDKGKRRRKLYRAVRFNPYLWPAHAAEPAGVSGSSGSAADNDDDRRMSGPTGRALFSAAGELGLAACFMPFKGLEGVADDIERLMDASPTTAVVIDHYGFCAASSGSGSGGGGSSSSSSSSSGGQRQQQQRQNQNTLLVGRSPAWRRLLSWARARPQVRVKASAAMRVSRAPYPHADASLHALRALVDAFGAERVLWGSDWPWVEDPATFAASAALSGGGGGDGGWAPYGYEGSWRLPTDAAATGADEGGMFVGGDGGDRAPAPRPAPLTDDEARWVFGDSARALFPGAWDE